MADSRENRILGFDEIPWLYDLEEASIVGPEGTLLGDLDLVIRDNAVTALLGPSGTGKSILLRALSGMPLPFGWRLKGSWKYRSNEFHPSNRRSLPVREIAWVPQRSSWFFAGDCISDVDKKDFVGMTWRNAFRPEFKTVLLDEPTVGATKEEITEIAKKIRRHKLKGATIIITHDVGFARFVADEVVLICAGKIIADCKAYSFFQEPSSELAARFIQQGNCWPDAPKPALPSHFRWILQDKLAGMGRPGLSNETEDDLYAIAQAGITLLISLTEEPMPAAMLRSFGIASKHFPIVDMNVPSINAAASLCRDIERAISNGERVAVHCHAGLGRTGTILASFLTWIGMGTDEAIQTLRSIQRSYIQTTSQLEFIYNFAEAVSAKKGIRK